MGRNANKANAGAAVAPKEDPKTGTTSDPQAAAPEENPLESAIQDPTPPAEQADVPAEQPKTDESLADDEIPEEEPQTDDPDPVLPAGTEPPEIKLKPIPTPEQCLGESDVFAGNRFLGLTSPSRMTSAQISQEIEDLGTPAERRAKASDALGAAKVERVRLIAELDQQIAQLEENLYGVTGWAYAADARIRQLQEHLEERVEAAEEAKAQAAKASAEAKAAKAAEAKAAKAAAAESKGSKSNKKA